MLISPAHVMLIWIVMHGQSLSLCETHAHTHTMHTFCLCGLTIKTVYSAATHSTAHTLNCVNVWVCVIFRGCHSHKWFSPVFNYWLCGLRICVRYLPLIREVWCVHKALQKLFFFFLNHFLELLDVSDFNPWNQLFLLFIWILKTVSSRRLDGERV